MRELSFFITYIYIALMVAALIGNTLVFYGFGTATERMNKRVRNATFKNLIRQEVAYFDMRPVSAITSQLSDDAAMIHSFSGEPIRTLVMTLASVLVGLVVSFIYMWPFALVALGVLPFMAFVSPHFVQVQIKTVAIFFSKFMFSLTFHLNVHSTNREQKLSRRCSWEKTNKQVKMIRILESSSLKVSPISGQ
jgi:ABC-type multidrug transport system fused ATPase/permease subunit